METCLRLAERAEGRTAPNPMVGALVLDLEGEIVAEGYHAKPGLAHAEVVALDQAGEAARGGTLYVNLEPCCHFGKTPPCTERVIGSGIKRVVAGMVDPNPEVSGLGLGALARAGIEVEVGVMEFQCRFLNRGFVKRMTRGLPWVILKLATTLDGKIADRAGSSRWISGPEARLHVHLMRNIFDCVMVGGKTALIDDPELNVREIEDGRDPVRAVVDPDLSVSPDARLCRQDSGGPTVIFCLPDSLNRKGREFPEHLQLVPIEGDPARPGYFNLSYVMDWFAGQGISTVLCEGGGRLAGGLLAKGLVDEVRWIVSPKILGDPEAIPALTGLGEVLLADARQLKHVSITCLGNDVLISGLLPPGYSQLEP